MISYPHFAVRGVYLRNGYREFESEDGVELEFDAPKQLELCIARILFREPSPLTPHQFRFLRRAAGLSQADFGALVDRDEQSVARWEKGSHALPRFADRVVRQEFAAIHEPEVGVGELTMILSGDLEPLERPIALTYSNGEWDYSEAAAPEHKLFAWAAAADAALCLPKGLGPTTFVLYYDHEKRSDVVPLRNTGMIVWAQRFTCERNTIDVTRLMSTQTSDRSAGKTTACEGSEVRYVS